MKMKNMKKAMIIVLAVMLAVVFAGCGVAKRDDGGNAGGSPAPAQKEATLEGTYYAQFDMQDIVAAQITTEYDIDASSPLIMDLQLVLNDDETYTMSFDLDSFLANTEAYYYTIFPRLIESIFAEQGMSSDQIEPALQGLGYSGLSEYMDEMVEEAMQTVRDEYADGDNTVTKGTYKVDGDKIELFEDGSSTATDSGVINSDGTITIQNISLEGDSVDITFSK